MGSRIACVLAGVWMVAVCAFGQSAVNIPDDGLEAAVRANLGKPTGEILDTDMQGITNLNASDRGIVDLEGIFFCNNLNNLNLNENQISDISDLANLSSIESLFLGNNQIEDISVLANLSNLTSLSLSVNQVSNLSPLQNLLKLENLDLDSNQISSITPLQELASLVNLDVGTNLLTNISSVAFLGDLELFGAIDNDIVDISPLESLGNLNILFLGGNEITDLAALANNSDLVSGATVDVSNNPLSALACSTQIPVIEGRGVSITYDNACDGAPVAVCTGPQIVFLSQGVLLPSDLDGGTTDPDGDSLTFNIDFAPSYTPTCADTLLTPGTKFLTLHVTDGTNVDSCQVQVDVADDISPSAVGRPVTVALNAAGVGSITPTQANNGSNDNCGTPVLSLSKSSFNCADLGNSFVVLTATDGNGNTGTALVQVTVTDPSGACADCTAPCNDEPQIDNDGDGLIACAESFFGSSDANVDTDADGMPDGWEAQYCPDSDPNDAADAGANPDGDGFTNIEEFERRSDPSDANSPLPSLFVSKTGVDSPGRGTAATPLRSIAFALGEAVVKGGGAGAAILLGSGVYNEDVTLSSGIVLRPIPGGSATIQGEVVAVDGSELRYLTLLARDGQAAVVVNGGKVDIIGCDIEGFATRAGIGVYIQGADPDQVTIRDCVFESLLTGLHVEAGLPALAQSQFENLAFSAILVECDDKGDDVELVQPAADDPRTGFNTFFPTIDGNVVVNECGGTLNLKRNDWGLEQPSAEAIGNLVSGSINADEFLPRGGALLASSLFCHVFVAGTAQLPLPGALLRVGSLSQAADDEGFAVFAGVSGPSVTVEVSQVGFETQSRNVTVGQGVQGNDESFYLEMEGAPEEGEGEPEPPGGCPCNGEKQGPPQGGELVLSAMVLMTLLAGSMSKREH
jgi:hypothetical protein